MQSDYLMIGEITRPQGISGEMRVKHCTDDPNRFFDLEQVFIKRGESYAPIGIKTLRVMPGGDVVIIRLDGVDDANAAEALRGTELYVDRAHAVQLPEDADFIVDLIGLEAVDDEGANYGRIVDVLTSGPNAVYVIRGPRGEVLVPALKSAVERVDLPGGRILFRAARLREVAVFED